MADNHFERLVAEWYEYRGYIVRRNRRFAGAEIDILAFHAKTKHFVQIETGTGGSWGELELTYQKKFDAGTKYARHVFEDLDVVERLEQIAIFEHADTKKHPTVGGGTVQSLRIVLLDVVKELKAARRQVPEYWPFLRTFQMAMRYKSVVDAMATNLEEE